MVVWPREQSRQAAFRLFVCYVKFCKVELIGALAGFLPSSVLQLPQMGIRVKRISSAVVGAIVTGIGGNLVSWNWDHAEEVTQFEFWPHGRVRRNDVGRIAVQRDLICTSCGDNTGPFKLGVHGNCRRPPRFGKTQASASCEKSTTRPRSKTGKSPPRESGEGSQGGRSRETG